MNQSILGTMVIAAATMGSSLARAQIDFDPPANYGTGVQPDQTAVGDWDGDGSPDLAVTSDNPDKVSTYFNDGAGAFEPPMDVLLGGGSSPSALAAGDWDRDGDLDLAVALKQPMTVQLLVNQGTGKFVPGSQFSVGQRPVDIEAADFDADGDQDMAVSNRDGNTVTVLLNDGSGSFSAQTVDTGREPREITSGDLDGDGDRDLAVSAHDSRALWLLINDGSGTFSFGSPLSLSDKPGGLVAADLDRDGDMDLAATFDSNGAGFVTVFLQTSGSFLAVPFLYPTGGQDPGKIVADDFDLDGDTDVATVNSSSGSVGVLPNLGDGTFGAAVVFATNGISPDHLAVADCDSSGTMDLVATNRDSNNLSVFRNRNSDPWTDLGNALAGSSALPRLTGRGRLKPGTTVSLTVSNGLGSARTVLIWGLSRLDAPFMGGTLVPSPDLLLFGLQLDSSGQLTLSGTWPSGLPSGTDSFFQVWILDSGAVQGMSATNGLKGVAE